MTKVSKVFRPRSAWERAVLSALDDGKFASMGDILERIGVRISPSDREAGYRALESLTDRGLIEKRVPVLASEKWLWRLRLRRRG